jgi:hypothetical protein
MPEKHLLLSLCMAIALVFIGCSKQPQPMRVLQGYPLDAKTGIITQSDERTKLSIDRNIFAEGTGSLRITATEPITVRLFEVGDVDVENARLVYQAKLRTENVEGQVYLKMWCHFPEAGEFFSRGLETPLMGTLDWTTEEISFFLKKGQNPDNIKLNLVIDGTGTVWIDDIRLMKGPLK